MRIGAVVLAGWMGVASCGAQQMAGMKMQAVPPPAEMAVPVKMTGLGNAHIGITATPEAQAWFDQGLNLLHDFWDYEAVKAFEQGVRVDPKCAMCFWGLAQAEGFRGGAEGYWGKKAFVDANRLKKAGTEEERLYIEALEPEIKGGKKADAKSAKVLRKLVEKYPGDVEAKIYLANSLQDGYDEKGMPKAGTKEAIGILEGVLKVAPEDSAANHYWIHAIEPGQHPELAIPSSAKLARLAPTSGHMVHMPGHIYYRVGDYASAEHWFAASTEADEKYMREQHVGTDDDWNYVHNMMYGIANLMEEGKLGAAEAMSDRLAGAQGQMSATLYIWSARDSMARVSRRLPVALRLGDWDGMLGLLKGTPDLPNLAFLAGQLKDYGTGMRALETGDVAGAEAASSRMEAGLADEKKVLDAPAVKEKKKDKDAPPMNAVMPDAMAGPLVKSLGIAAMELKAGILLGKGKADEAKKMYADAAGKEKELGYHEPPFYIRPVSETEGAALLRAKDYAGAAKAYEAALVERPGSGFELYGLARVKEASGDIAGAKSGYAAFLKAWAGADAGLMEVVHAKAVVGAGAVGE